MIHRPTEEDYDAIRKLGAKLHIPTPEMFWGFKVEDPNGNILHDHDERGHSWVRNAYNALTSQMCAINSNGSTTFGENYLSFKNIAGTIQGSATAGLGTSANYNLETSGGGFGGSLGAPTPGIIIGTGTSAFSFEDYKLVSQISHGTTPGAVSYGAANAIVKNYNTGTKTYAVTHSRYFTNNSGSAIVVAEVGIVTNGLVGNGTSAGGVLFVRDVLETPVTVANLARLTVTYTMTVTYPA